MKSWPASLSGRPPAGQAGVTPAAKVVAMGRTRRTGSRAWLAGWLAFTGAVVGLAATDSPFPGLDPGVAHTVRAGGGGWVTRDDGVVLEAGSAVASPAGVDPTLVDGTRLERYVTAVTSTNSGLVTGAARWDRPVVRYRVGLDDSYPVGVRQELAAAFAWVSTVTGVPFVGVDGAAEIEVVGRGDNGGLTVFDAPGGELTRARIELGCCRRRVVWEEVLHAVGLISDQGPGGSLVAAYDLRDLAVVDAPTVSDATVLRALYTVRPGAGAAEVRTAIRSIAGG